MVYLAQDNRYDKMPYRRIGNTGLKLPLISLGLWRGYGDEGIQANTRKSLRYAFDHGITHFDMANNYGPTPGSAEEAFGAIYQKDFKPYRDELILSSKAGFDMWTGPYGANGSKKHLIASLDQSLQRTGLDYFDIFYTHRPDPETSMEETAETLDLMVRQGKALYIGISNYYPKETKEMIRLFKEMKTPFILNQFSYNMLNREAEETGLLDMLKENNAGLIAYGPLAQGLLTDKNSAAIPSDLPIHRTNKSLLATQEHEQKVSRTLKGLKELADNRNQSLSQMALAWLLKDETVSSVIIGATQVKHIEDNLAALNHLDFTVEELTAIDDLLRDVSL